MSFYDTCMVHSQVNKRRVGRTALHCAAALGDTAMIKLLLQFGATVDIAVRCLD